jgi:nucleoside-diphosphate kinase
MERTLVLLKPDCVQRRLAGRVIGRFEEKGLNIIAMKLMRVTPELARRHYAEHVEKGWYPELEGFITASPIVAMVVEGPEAIRVVREMVGVTNGLKANPGTIRGDYSTSQQMNLVHASDGPEAARREVEIFFAPAEIHDYTPTLRQWTHAV